jgi:homoserine O-acetyltransferase/O-succinyltransferase
MRKTLLVASLLLCAARVAQAQYPTPAQGDAMLRTFQFADGESLPELRIHYRTIGHAVKDAHGMVTNAVLIMHGTGGSGAQFIRPVFAGALFGPGQLLDATKYYLILPDGIGHGGSSKPSDGLRAKFPHYGYRDMIHADYRMLTEALGVNHLRLVMGTSMGGMHTWLWGEMYPDFMDALMPLASLPTQIAGRNRVWRRIGIDAIRDDPEWQGGNYTKQPEGLRTAEEILFDVSSNPVLRRDAMPTLHAADSVLDAYVTHGIQTTDANDLLYALRASEDYDPGPGLEKITAPLMAVNSADDLINPPELGILQREIQRVPHGRAVVIPFSPQTRGHQSHTVAALWEQYLAQLLQESAR